MISRHLVSLVVPVKYVPFWYKCSDNTGLLKKLSTTTWWFLFSTCSVNSVTTSNPIPFGCLVWPVWALPENAQLLSIYI